MLSRLIATRNGALIAIALVCFLSGCGSRTPTTVHGKPVEYWLNALHDSDARIRKKAVESLGNVGAENSAIVPALIATLEDRDANVRSAAVLALLKIGPDAGESVPALRKTLKDKDAKVRDYAKKALERIEDANPVN
jgi:HEAT repeat protein